MAKTFRDWLENDWPHLMAEIATVKAHQDADRWLLRALVMALGIMKLVEVIR